jgi:23S rRNA pseudouridine1911/1915/1917 synthase
MPESVYTFIVCSDDLYPERISDADSRGVKGKYRLDMFLSAQDPISLSRSQIRKLIIEGDVTVNGQLTKPGYWVKESDAIVVTLPEPSPLTLVAEDIPLNILYEDDQLIVLNKPVGMVVHPAPGHYKGTLVHALLHHCQGLSGIGGVQRPGIIHRLDRDTSGVMLVAKTDESHTGLSDQLKSRELISIYCAIVHGRFKTSSERIEAPIGRHRKDRKKMTVDWEAGRYALTLYQVLQQYAEHALLKIELKTGRTHQIRVHMKSIHHPVVGDLVYGNSSKNNLDMPRQALHAQTVTFTHPVTRERMQFETPLPEDMKRVLEKLRVKCET